MIDYCSSAISASFLLLAYVSTFQIQDPSKAAVYDTVVFEGPPMTEQTLWPRHCVQETWGAELHKDLKVRGLIRIKEIKT